MEKESHPKFFRMTPEQEKEWESASPEVKKKAQSLLDNHVKRVEIVLAIKTIRKLDMQREFVEYLYELSPMCSIYHAIVEFVNRVNEKLKTIEDQK